MAEGPGPSGTQRRVSMEATETSPDADDFRRNMRQQYRDLSQIVQENRTALVSPGNEGLSGKMDFLNSQVVHISHPREFALDATLVRQMAEMGAQQADHIRIDAFDKEKYIGRLYTEMGGHRQGSSAGVLDWGSLGRKVVSAYRRTPDVEFLNGALEIVPRKKMQRKARQERPTASETVRPNEVQEMGDSEEVTTRDVQHLLKHLKAAISRSPEKKVNYFRFLVHPDSFAQTVENFFHFSFLIKDGRVCVEVHRGQPHICFPERVDANKQSTKTTRKQAVLSLDYSRWEAIKAHYSITEPAFPPRIPIGQI